MHFLEEFNDCLELMVCAGFLKIRFSLCKLDILNFLNQFDDPVLNQSN